MEDVDDAVLDVLKDERESPQVLEKAVDYVIALERLSRTDAVDPCRHMRARLSTLDVELTRLAAALASGADLPTIVAEITKREEEKKRLQAQMRLTPAVSVSRAPIRTL